MISWIKLGTFSWLKGLIICCHCVELKAFLMLRVMMAQHFLVHHYHLIPVIANSARLITALIASTVNRSARKPYCPMDMPPASSTIGNSVLHIMRSSNQMGRYDDDSPGGLPLFGSSTSICHFHWVGKMPSLKQVLKVSYFYRRLQSHVRYSVQPGCFFSPSFFVGNG